MDDGAKGDFLAILMRCGNVSYACRKAKLERRTAYRWREQSEAFRKAWDEAAELGTDALEDEAIRRGFRGVRKPVFQGGQCVGYVREFSDTLLIFLLKARRPNKFREQYKHEVSGPDGKEIAYKVTVNGITPEQFRQLPQEERVRFLREATTSPPSDPGQKPL
jgi:hypothetical protein